MTTVVIIIHVLACVALVLVVLLQAGKGASMGAAFGGSSQTVFGSAGATTFLAKMTTMVALVFMLTSLGLAVFSGKGAPPSVMDGAPAQTAPATEQAAPAPATEAK
ncbi:MAG: preprotein translocase subunit SecG [Desulfarculus sp.]|nr:preprotein translocase subunit SecG [Desulfarculus sp.]